MTSFLAAIDLDAARDGIARDLGELLHGGAIGITILVVAAALPAAAGAAVLARRYLAAALPLAVAAGLATLWFLYYATDWFANPGQGAWLWAMLLVLGGYGWLVYGVMDRRGRRRRRA